MQWSALGRPADSVVRRVAPAPSEAGVEPEWCVLSRRNDSLGEKGRWLAFALVGGTSLTLGLSFLIVGAWPILPWSLVEITVLAVAFVMLARRAGDWGRLTVAGDRVIVERVRGGRMERHEWNRRWLRVETTGEDGAPVRVLLSGAGERCEFGALMREDERRKLARRLRRLAAQ
jgi:uncharacterized membrane protein